MKNKPKVNWLVIVILLLIGLAQPTGQSRAAVGFRVSGRYILDANGNIFIMRGINHAHTWYPAQTSSFANIKNTRANTIRVVLSTGARWTKNSASDVANVISLCKNNHLICVLEVHDTTGYGEQSGAISLSKAVAYWKGIQSVLTGQEAYVIINIGNEPYGNNNTANWIRDTKNAISQMRSAGFEHTLMVDAPNWGQDWQFIMRDNAASIFNSDPDRNTIFSIHMYGVFDTAGEVQSYISTFVNNDLPLVIGEFGHNHSDGNPDEDAIMAQAQSNCIGYIGWSWSGNSGGVEYLDMVTNFDPNQLTWWGNRIINGNNGIKQTSLEASVYNDIQPTLANFRSNGTQDGWILESTETSNRGGTMNNATTVFYLGDDVQDRQYRAVLSFDTSSLPNDAIIAKVTLKIRKQGLAGTDPFTTHGNILVEIRKGAFGNNNALQLTDFQAAASNKNCAGTIKNTPSSNWYSVTLCTAFTNLSGITQFRLHFQKDDNDDNGADYLKFYSGNYTGAASRPQLIIEYYVP